METRSSVGLVIFLSHFFKMTEGDRTRFVDSVTGVSVHLRGLCTHLCR